MHVYDILEQLAVTSSRNEKIEILKQHQEDVVFRKVLFEALSPTRCFYIRQIPEYIPVEASVMTVSAAMKELDRFATREMTGNAAVYHLTQLLSSLDHKDASIIERILAKDLRCGVSDSTVNKVWAQLIPEYPYMRASLPKHVKLNTFDWKSGVFSQLKADGMFCNCNYTQDGDVQFLSRAGSVLPMEHFGDLVEAIKSSFVLSTQTHGELLVEKNGQVLPREVGNGIINSVLKGGSFAPDEVPQLLVWDQIPLDQAIPGNKYKIPYKQRFASIQQQVGEQHLIVLIPTKIVYSLEEAIEHYSEMLQAGLEGTIIKDPYAIWEDTTSKKQVKFKLDVDVDLKIIGFTEGKGKNASTFGSVTCSSSCGQLIVNVSGFKDKKQPGILTRKEIYDKRDLLIDTVLAVKSNNLLPPTKNNEFWSLFLPRAIEFRQDKFEADSLQRIKDQFESAIRGVKV